MARPPGLIEQRRHPRIPVSVPAHIWVDEELIVGRTVNVSACGLFIATAPTAALKVGHSCRVEVVAAAPAPHVLDVEVRHASELGVGMEIGEPVPGSWTRWTWPPGTSG